MRTGVVAEKKTPPGSPRSGRNRAGTGKAKTAATGKPAPEVIDPPGPKPEPAAKAKKPETVDVTPVSVSETPPAGPAAGTRRPKPAADAAQTPPAPDAAGDPAPAESGRHRFPALLAALFLGGLLAGGIGYYSARLATPPPDGSAEIRALAGQIANDMAALETRLAALESRPPDPALERIGEDLAALSERLELTESQLQQLIRDTEETRQRIAESLSAGGTALDATVTGMLDGLAAEIAALKDRVDAGQAAGTALAARLDSLSESMNRQIESVREGVDSLSSSAAAAVQGVDLARNMERLRAALDSGRAYADILAEIARQAAIDIPEALQRGAEAGIPPLLKLQSDFPAAARAGLKAAIRAEAGEGVAARLGAFLKSQIAARSLEARPGDDPDAILSRAEAALKQGRLRAAVDLVRSLPPAAIDAMAGWLESAEKRLGAEAGLEALGNRLNGSD